MRVFGPWGVLVKEAIMKYVITWTPRSGGSAAENEASAARVLDLVSKWAPGPDETVHQWVLRIDGQGGFAVVEGDNPADFLRNTAVWSPFSDFTIYPVVDFAEGMQVIREGTEWRKSIT
jgi:hypothetical protein